MSSWIESEAVEWKELLSLLITFLLCKMWVAISLLAIHLFILGPTARLDSQDIIQLATHNFVLFVITLCATSLFEELVFRALPVYVAMRIVSAGRVINKQTVFLVSMVVSSILFALYHELQISIVIQFFGGMITFIFFLKCGGYQGKLLKPLLMSSVLHFFFNLTIILPILFSVEV